MITIRLEEDIHSLEEGTDITKQLWTMSLMASLNRKGGETLTSDPRGINGITVTLPFLDHLHSLERN